MFSLYLPVYSLRFFIFSRFCLTELKRRSFCPYVKWANTVEPGLACAHCERLSTTELTIDYLHDKLISVTLFQSASLHAIFAQSAKTKSGDLAQPSRKRVSDAVSPVSTSFLARGDLV